MPDLGRSDAEWARFLGLELGGLVLAPGRDLWEIERKFRLEREQCVVLDSRGTFVGMVQLSGVRLGVNTSVEGFLYARLTNNGGGPNKDIKLYKATGGSGEVAAASNVAPGATATLTASNSSGLTGSWPLPNPSAETTDDTLIVMPLVDYQLRASRVLDGTAEKDVAARAFLIGLYRQVADQIRQIRQAFLTAVQAYFTRVDLRGAAFTRESHASMATEANTQDTSGNRFTSATGFLPFLKLCMQAETTGSEQDVKERAVAAGAGVMDAGNVGQFQVQAHTPREHAKLGRSTWRCVRGVEDDAIGAEQFEGRLKVAGEDQEINLGIAQVGRVCSRVPGIGPFTVERLYTKTGDDDDDNLAATDDGGDPKVNLVSVSGENNLNTDEGKFYGLVEETDTDVFSYTFWASATARAQRIERQIVAKATGVVAEANFVATGYNNFPNLKIAWQAGDDPVDATEFELHVNPARRERGDGQPDQFTIDITVQDEGTFQRLLGEFFGYHLNSDEEGSESISDGYATAGTFPPRAVLDV